MRWQFCQNISVSPIPTKSSPHWRSRFSQDKDRGRREIASVLWKWIIWSMHIALLYSFYLLATTNFARMRGFWRYFWLTKFLGPRGPLIEHSSVPSRPPVPSTRANFSWVHRWALTLFPGLRYPSNCIFYESWWCQLSNSDENTNTKTNTDTNTNTETNKGKTNDSYDVIYCLKVDDKRILNMICYRQGL